MSGSLRRAPRRGAHAQRAGSPWFALVLAGVGSILALLAPRLARAEPDGAPSPTWLASREPAAEVLVFPPRDRQVPRPVTVMLHGMCDEPENECPYFAEVVTRKSWLVCPRASMRCPGGGSIWSYQRRQQTVEDAVALVRDRFPGELDERSGTTLIGFSLGALVGMDLGHRAHGRYPRLLLIGAKVEPFPSLLRREGVERVVFAAGDLDMMSGHMRDRARALERQGFPARFESLGRVGHGLPADFDAHLESMLTWLESPP
jgi:predicted esterase